jgi:peroxiredoxin Q/BCP
MKRNKMRTPIKKLNYRFLMLLALISLTAQSFTIKNQKMEIKPGIAAPAFTIMDLNGKQVNLSDFKGKKILLTFYRNVGCPICNLRFHEIQEQSEYFKSKNLIVLAVYESSAENMKKYLAGENPYAVMLPNPEQNLYHLYDIERSKLKAFNSVFHGAISKAKKGTELFKTKMKQDGNGSTIGADFLIDENGIVNTAYYGKFIGDHLPVASIKSFLN